MIDYVISTDTGMLLLGISKTSMVPAALLRPFLRASLNAIMLAWKTLVSLLAWLGTTLLDSY